MQQTMRACSKITVCWVLFGGAASMQSIYIHADHYQSY